jgi:hypothetical protein
MAKVRCKGTVIHQEIANTMVAIAQVISLDLPEGESETYESDTLDNTSPGIPYDPTGRVEGGSAKLEIFFDPSLAGHQALTDLLRSPAKRDFEIVFADDATTTWAFTAAGIKFGGAVALKEGLKGTVELKLDGTVDYPT